MLLSSRTVTPLMPASPAFWTPFAVGVEPDPVTDSAVAVVAEVDVAVGLVGTPGVTVTTLGVPMPSKSKVGFAASGQSGVGHRDREGPRRKAGEAIVSITAGDRGPDHVATRVSQGDGDAIDAIFAAVLDAVAVGIEPDPVTESAAALVAEVSVVDHGASRDGDRGSVIEGSVHGRRFG